MVATKIIGLYSTIWVPLLSDEVTGHDLIDFSKKLPQLRKYFSCSVCDQLLTNREVISPSNCLEHFACKACRGKDRDPDRKCPKCGDWSTFGENETLDALLRSYQMFCRHILTCERIVRLLEVKHEVDPGFDSITLIDLLGEGLKGAAPVGGEGGKKRRLPNEDVKVGRGVVPIAVPIPTKRSKKVPVPGSDGNLTTPSKSTRSMSTPTNQNPTTSLPTPTTPVPQVMTKGNEAPSERKLKSTIQSDPVEKAKPSVSKQVEKVVPKAPPPAVTTVPPAPPPTKPVVSTAKQLPTSSYSVTTSSQVTKSITVSSPVPRFTSVGPQGGTKSVTVSSPATKAPTFPSPVMKPATSQATKLVTVPSTSKSTAVSSPTVKSVTVSSSTTKSANVVTSSSTGVAVVKVEAHEGSSPSFEAHRSPRKGLEEDTYILGLSPSTSPTKTVPPVSIPSPASITSTNIPIITSTPSQISTSSFPTTFKITPTLTSAGQRAGIPHIVQFNQTDGIMKTVQIGGQHIRLATSTNFTAFQAARQSRAGNVFQIFRPGAPLSGTGIIGPGGSGSPPLLIKTSIHQPGKIPSTSTVGITSTSNASHGRVFLTTASPQDLHHWPDPTKTMQFPASEMGGIQALVALRAQAAALQARQRIPVPTPGTITNVRSVSAAGSLVRPSSTITTASFARGLVQPPVVGTSRMTMPQGANVQFVRAASGNTVPVILRPEGMASTQSAAIPPQVPVSSTTPTTNNPLATSSTSKRKQEGCRCGNATPTPGKLTCIGQRCACYADKTACMDCKCKGCKNPYVAGAGKILPGVRALIDPQTNQTIPLLAAPMNTVGVGHTTTNFVNSSVAAPNPTIMTGIGPASNIGPIPAGTSIQNPNSFIIPIRYGHPGSYAPQYIQIASSQGVQNIGPIYLSTSGGHIQGSPGGGITLQQLQGLTGLSAASGAIHQLSGAQLRPGMVPVTGTMKVESRGLNDQ